jgi:hypothetical protein
MEHLLIRGRPLRVAAFSLVTGVGISGIAYAEEAAPAPDPSALFAEATRAMEAADYRVACPKLEEVVRLVPEGLGAKLALGDCYEGAGRLATAQRAYVAAAAAAAAANNRKRQAEAQAKADALNPRLARLVLQVAPEVASLQGLTITRDGAPISLAEVGIPVAVDAGTFTFRVFAPGKQPRDLVASGVADGATVTVKVERLDDEVAPARPIAVLPMPPPEPRMTNVPFWSAQRIGGLSVGLGGVVGLGLGGLFAGLTASALGESEDLGCNSEGQCPTQEGVDVRERALVMSHGATASLVAGGVLALTGVLVFATAPSGPEIVVASQGVVMRGAF